MCLVINCNLQTPNHVLINLNVLRHERNEVCLPTTMTFLTNLAFPPPTATKPHTPKSLSLAGLGWDYSLPARNTRSNATKKKGQHEKKEGSYDGYERHNFYRRIRENCFLSFKISLTFGCIILQQPCLDPSGDQKNRLGIPKRDWVATTYFLFALRNQYWLASAGWRSLQFTSYFWSLKEVPSPFSGGITALSSLPPLLSIRMHVCYLP